jgi:hypothetical protein
VAQSMLVQAAFTNTGELAIVDEAKPVVWRHVDNRWYRPLAYQLALIIVQLPVYIIETCCALSLIYWVSGWNPNAGSILHFSLPLPVRARCSVLG